MYLKTGNLQQCHKNEKKRGGIKSTLLVKWAASAQNLCPQAHWANCPLLQFGNNSDYIVSFCRLENQNKLPAHCSLLLFHIDVQTLAVNYWKERLTVWVCLSLSDCLLKQLLHQSYPMSCVLVMPPFLFCLFLLHCCSSVGCSQKTQSRWTQ